MPKSNTKTNSFNVTFAKRNSLKVKDWNTTKNFCGKKGHDKSTLAMQTFNIQNRSNPFSCETCGESYSSNSILEAHERFHTGGKLCLLVENRLANHTRVKKDFLIVYIQKNGKVMLPILRLRLKIMWSKKSK